MVQDGGGMSVSRESDEWSCCRNGVFPKLELYWRFPLTRSPERRAEGWGGWGWGWQSGRSAPERGLSVLAARDRQGMAWLTGGREATPAKSPSAWRGDVRGAGHCSRIHAISGSTCSQQTGTLPVPNHASPLVFVLLHAYFAPARKILPVLQRWNAAESICAHRKLPHARFFNLSVATFLLLTWSLRLGSAAEPVGCLSR